MTDLALSEVIDLARGLVVANTPSSLLSWLCRHPAVQRIADQLTEDMLLDILSTQARVRPRTEISVAKAYAALVAIIIRRRRTMPLGNPPVETTLLEWLGAMWNQARHSSPTTSTQIYEAPRPPVDVQVRAQSEPGRTLLVDRSGNTIIRAQGSN